MRKLLIAGAAAILLAACSSGSNSADTSPSPTQAATVPTVSQLKMKSAVHCQSGQVPVEVKWETTDADSAAISVDGTEVSKDLEPNGSATIDLECKDATHEVMLMATGADGQSASEVHKIKTVKAQPVSLPVIDNFTVTTGACSGSALQATATYTTTGATTVAFEVDGQAPGAQAGLDTSGTANVPDVPCDGKSHQITLVASNAANQNVQATQTVKGAATPVITNFSVASQVHCTGSDVAVKVTWASTGATSAEVTLDGGVAAKGQPASGSTEVSVPCSQGSQKIGLVVTASDGKQASVVHTIQTIPGGGGAKPVINSFELTSPRCEGDTTVTKATYSTSDATSVAFLVDGEDPGMQAGLPTSGKANVPDVPCDGENHQVTLVATNSAGKSVQQSQTVGGLL